MLLELLQSEAGVYQAVHYRAERPLARPGGGPLGIGQRLAINEGAGQQSVFRSSEK